MFPPVSHFETPSQDRGIRTRKRFRKDCLSTIERYSDSQSPKNQKPAKGRRRRRGLDSCCRHLEDPEKTARRLVGQRERTILGGCGVFSGTKNYETHTYKQLSSSRDEGITQEGTQTYGEMTVSSIQFARICREKTFGGGKTPMRVIKEQMAFRQGKTCWDHPTVGNL